MKFFDAGDYLCNATNKFGWRVAEGSLIVKEHTRITAGPQDYEVEAGDTATFRCNAVYDSDLSLAIKWLKDSELIDFDVEPRFIQSSDQSLTITKTTELDSGRYTCLAQSDLDSASANATLIVQDVPNPPMLRWVECNAKVIETNSHKNALNYLYFSPCRTPLWSGSPWGTTEPLY